MASFGFATALAVSSAVALCISAGPALAQEDKQVCAQAYEQTQTAKRNGQLRTAREQAAICVSDACPEFIKKDCGQWLSEIDASQPTVVIDVRVDGKEVTEARVLLDGRPWITGLDGRAHPIDPGQHTIRYEAGGAASEETVQIREGEKNRKLQADLRTGPGGRPGGDGRQPPIAPSRPSEAAPVIAPWVIGSVGVAGLIAGVVMGTLVVSDKAVTEDHCDEATLACPRRREVARSARQRRCHWSREGRSPRQGPFGWGWR